MANRWRTWSIGLACLTLAAAAPWAVSSTPVDRPQICDAPCRGERPAVKLEFAEPPAACTVCPTAVDLPTTSAPGVRLPIDLPGATSPLPPFPKFDPTHAAEHADAIDKLYPPLPPMGMVLPPERGPEGRPITLEDLQHYAEASSPLIRQAAAESAATASAGFCDLHAILVAQHRHVKAIAAADRELAQLTHTRVEAEVLTGVRRGYFAVLAAQESMRVHEAFARFSDDAYRQHVERAKAGQAASSEPLQLRTLAYQARTQLVQSRNRYLAAWKQLAATVGRLDLQPSQLAGQIDRPLPIMSFEKLHACVLSRNSEVAAAQHELERAQSVLRSYTAPPFAIFHRAAAARAKTVVARAQEEPEIVRAMLTAELAEAFERYDNQRRILAYYRDNIIPDQVKTYRVLAARPAAERAGIVDTVVAQQALANSVATYLNSLGEAWFAVADLGRLIQSRDLFTGDAICGSQVACLDLPACAGGSCRAGASAMHWPEVEPSLNEPPTANVPRIIPGVTCGPCATPTSPPREAAPACADCRPLMGTLVAPLASAEKSTKRRRFFTWPSARDAKPPQTLPQEDEPSQCSPKVDLPSTVIPKSLPQPTSEFVPPITLPDVPVKQVQADPPSPRKEIPLPKIVDGPSETKKSPPRAAAAPKPAPIPTPEIIIPVAATRSAAHHPLPQIIDGPTPRPVPQTPPETTTIPPPRQPAPPTSSPREMDPEIVPAIAPRLRLSAPR